ncbi:MFS family permease [Bacillus mesophilus]|uniref:MFS transporter n=1 Tax=Bacillus mesophilus TaxID=1808955 RepID=A0A6M0QAV0_9BACI|nr:MFS transporter [Bacillus mesophilus]MBM7661487.1 MFS family permease [Bacillus mesophilus]NEY72158.1 MFS transporter [Bacillus mesophilus]
MFKSNFNTLPTALKILLLGVLLSHLAYYIVLPLLPIVLKVLKGLTIVQIGTVLAVSSFSYQGGSVIGGLLADKIGRRMIIVIGAFVKGVGLIGFAIAGTYPLLLMVAMINGLGGGLNSPSTKAAIAALASEGDHRTTVFSLRGIAANLGIASAGLLTYFLIGEESIIIFYISAGLFFVLGIISWLFVPANCGEGECEDITFQSYLEIFKNKAFVIYSIMSIFVWGLFAQFALALPLRAESFMDNPTAVSLVWTFNSILVVIFQTTITNRIIRKINPMNALALGTAFIGFGISSLYFANHFSLLIVSGVIFIIGEMILMPTIDITITQLGTAQLIGTYFGLANFIFGLGEGLGNFGGARLLSLGIQTYLPWISYLTVAVIVALVIYLIRNTKPMKSVF